MQGIVWGFLALATGSTETQIPVWGMLLSLTVCQWNDKNIIVKSTFSSWSFLFH